MFDERISGPVAQSNCVGCHAAGGEADDTRLTLVPETTADHTSLNREAFAEFVADVEAGEALILAKMRGDADHGGGVQVAEDSAEYADMVRFLRLVVRESTASFDSITYAGSATLGNGERMAASDLLIEVPERTLVDDISISVSEMILPAALPPGFRQIADPVEIAIADEHQNRLNGPLTVTMTLPEGTRENGDLVVLRYEPTSEQWFGSHDEKPRPGRLGVWSSNPAFSVPSFVGRAASLLPAEFSTGFDAARHGFSIENNEVEYRNGGGNGFGMSAFAIYHFNFAEGDLHDRWGRTVQTLVATLAQSTTPAMYLNSEVVAFLSVRRIVDKANDANHSQPSRADAHPPGWRTCRGCLRLRWRRVPGVRPELPRRGEKNHRWRPGLCIRRPLVCRFPCRSTVERRTHGGIQRSRGGRGRGFSRFGSSECRRSRRSGSPWQVARVFRRAQRRAHLRRRTCVGVRRPVSLRNNKESRRFLRRWVKCWIRRERDCLSGGSKWGPETTLCGRGRLPEGTGRCRPPR